MPSFSPSAAPCLQPASALPLWGYRRTELGSGLDLLGYELDVSDPMESSAWHGKGDIFLGSGASECTWGVRRGFDYGAERRHGMAVGGLSGDRGSLMKGFRQRAAGVGLIFSPRSGPAHPSFQGLLTAPGSLGNLYTNKQTKKQTGMLGTSWDGTLVGCSLSDLASAKFICFLLPRKPSSTGLFLEPLHHLTRNSQRM